MPSPLRPFDKLRHRVDWSALAPYVSNLTIQLDPCLDGTAGLKYVLARGSACRRQVCLAACSHRRWLARLLLTMQLASLPHL